MSVFRQVAARPALVKLALTVAAASGLGAFVAPQALARDDFSAVDGTIRPVVLSTLSPQVQQTRALIRSGGPFPYGKDGSVFMNRERLLPLHPRGYYREYTVKTPGSRDRGAQRIVCGGLQPRLPDACYYTADHYASFRLLVQ